MILARARAWLTHTGTHRPRPHGRHDNGDGTSTETWRACDPPDQPCVYVYENATNVIISEQHCARHGGQAQL